MTDEARAGKTPSLPVVRAVSFDITAIFRALALLLPCSLVNIGTSPNRDTLTTGYPHLTTRLSVLFRPLPLVRADLADQ